MEPFLKCFRQMKSGNGHMRLEDSSDVALMRDISIGRQDVLKVLMDRYMPMVSRTSFRILCDFSDSGIVTRDTFIRVWKNSSAFDGSMALSVWLLRITCGLCYGRLRRRRLLDLVSIRPDVYEASAPAALSPDEEYITRETWAIFCRASHELSSRQRVVFTLRQLEGLSTEETALITGMSFDNIRENLHVARKRLRQELEKYGKVNWKY